MLVLSLPPPIHVYSKPTMLVLVILFLLIPRPPTSTLFPYTTLFRSQSLLQPSSFFSSQLRGSGRCIGATTRRDRKSTRLNSSHQIISYAAFCLKKKKTLPSVYWPGKLRRTIHSATTMLPTRPPPRPQ